MPAAELQDAAEIRRIVPSIMVGFPVSPAFLGGRMGRANSLNGQDEGTRGCLETFLIALTLMTGRRENLAAAWCNAARWL
jgi:hypothetical protein